MAESYEWFFAINDQRYGPEPIELVHRRIAAGEITAASLVWKAGMTDWLPAGTLPEFAPFFEAAPAASMSQQPANLGQQPALAPHQPAMLTPQTGAQTLGALQYYTQPQTAPPYAGFWLRFCAAFIDGIIVSIPNCILGGIIGAVFGEASAIQTSGSGMTTTTTNTASTIASLFSDLIGLVIAWLYAAYMESSKYQATLGKQAVGICVTDLNGERLSFANATGRHFAKYLSMLTLTVGYIMAAFTERKQALHDYLAGTLVVIGKRGTAQPQGYPMYGQVPVPPPPR